MNIKKITTGFVTQIFDSESGKLIEQKFTASDDVVYEPIQGEPVDLSTLDLDNGFYHQFDMVQPIED